MRVRTIFWFRKERELDTYRRVKQEGGRLLSNYVFMLLPFNYPSFSSVVWYCYGFLGGSNEISNRKRFEEEYFQWKAQNED